MAAICLGLNVLTTVYVVGDLFSGGFFIYLFIL